jgi:hypothetical protein
MMITKKLDGLFSARAAGNYFMSEVLNIVPV